MEIEKDWIDYNGHLNMAYYNVLFDRCSDDAFEMHGHGAGLCQGAPAHHLHGGSPCLLRAGTASRHKVTVSFQLIDHDEKRLRAYQEIRHVDGWLAATSETLSLHVDMAGPKVAPFPADVAGQGRGDARRPCRAADAGARRPLDRHPPKDGMKRWRDRYLPGFKPAHNPIATLNVAERRAENLHDRSRSQAAGKPS